MYNRYFNNASDVFLNFVKDAENSAEDKARVQMNLINVMNVCYRVLLFYLSFKFNFFKFVNSLMVFLDLHLCPE